MIAHYHMFAAYNAWANTLLYDAAATLTPQALNEDRGAYFGSLFATLSHILVADRIWMHRFAGEGPSHKSLNEQPYSTLPQLTEARKAEDARIINWVSSLSPEMLDQPFTYTPITNPSQITHKLGPALSHFFNHQTHHRGQAHMTLTALGKPSLSLDLIYFLRSAGQQWL